MNPNFGLPTSVYRYVFTQEKFSLLSVFFLIIMFSVIVSVSSVGTNIDHIQFKRERGFPRPCHVHQHTQLLLKSSNSPQVGIDRFQFPLSTEVTVLRKKPSS